MQGLTLKAQDLTVCVLTVRIYGYNPLGLFTIQAKDYCLHRWNRITPFLRRYIQVV